MTMEDTSMIEDKDLSINVKKLLNVSTDDLDAVWKHYNVSTKVLEDMVNGIRDWYEKQPHLPQGYLHDRFIVGHLISRAFSMERVKQKIDNYLLAKCKMPDIVCDRDPLSPELNKYLRQGYLVVLPKKTPDNYRVTIFREYGLYPYYLLMYPSMFVLGMAGYCRLEVTRDVALANYVVRVLRGMIHHLEVLAALQLCVANRMDSTHEATVSEIVKIGTMMVEYRFWNDAYVGDIWIMDCSNINLSHALQMTPVMISKLMFYLTECFGVTVKSIHLVNLPSYALTVFSLFKKAMKSKIIQRIHLHDKFEDSLKLYPKKMIPKDFGGDEISLKEITDEWVKTFQTKQWRQYFIDQESIRTDESKRVVKTDAHGRFGIDGSFRKLDLD